MRGVANLPGLGLMVRDLQDNIVLHPMAKELYQYHRGYRFDPGSSAETFQPLHELPLQSFRGRGRLAGSLRVTQPPQVWYNKQVTPMGLGGIQTGQIISQPLYDPSVPIPDYVKDVK